MITLEETDVCDECHSPGGAYNGVNSTGDSVGAKQNWKTGGVYEGDTLKEGKDKWCAGCHDDSAAVIKSVTAPNVIGFEDGDYTYGTGYGFYKTGHGLPSTETYPASGGLTNGAGKVCTNCHDTTVRHIDSLARTFDCTDGCNPTEYQQSYRLRLVDGANPLEIPRQRRPSSMILKDNFKLCFQSGCHDPDRYTNPESMVTGFRDETSGDYPEFPNTASLKPFNAHTYHLHDEWNWRFNADWGGLMVMRIA